MTAFASAYYVGIMWDGSSWTDEWSNVKQITFNRGRTGGILSQPEIGKCELVMVNDDKRFSPAYSSGALYGNLLPSREVYIAATIGKAATFDGSNYLQLGTDHADFKIESHLAFGAVFKPTATGHGTQRVLAKADPAGELCYQLTWDETNGIQAQVQVANETQTAADSTMTNANDWYFAVACYDYEALYLYTANITDNSDLTDTSTACRGDVEDSTEKLTLGADSAGGNNFYGSITYAFVRDDWLSALEVKTILSRGMSYHPKSTHLQGYWSFAEEDASDDSGNSHTLTASGTVSYGDATGLYDVALWRGKTKAFRMEATERQAHIDCVTEEEGFDLHENDLTPQTSLTTGDLVDDALDDYDWDTDNRIVETGLTTVPVGGWARRSALSIAHDLAEAEHGLFFFNRRGWPAFENRNHRRLGQASEAQTDFDGTALVADAEYVLSDENVYPYVKVRYYPRIIQALQVVWRGDVPFEMSNGDTLTIGAYYMEEGRQVECIDDQCVATTDYTANESSSGTGADRTASLSVTLTSYGASYGRLDLTASADLYVTKLQVQAKPYYDYYPTESFALNSTNVTAYGPRMLVLDNKFLQQHPNVTSDPFAYMLLERFEDPVASIDPVRVQANRNATQLRETLTLDVSDRIKITDTLTGLSAAEYWIEHVRHEVTHGETPHHYVEFNVSPYNTYGYWVLGTSEFDGDTTLAF